MLTTRPTRALADQENLLINRSQQEQQQKLKRQQKVSGKETTIISNSSQRQQPRRGREFPIYDEDEDDLHSETSERMRRMKKRIEDEGDTTATNADGDNDTGSDTEVEDTVKRDSNQQADRSVHGQRTAHGSSGRDAVDEAGNVTSSTNTGSGQTNDSRGNASSSFMHRYQQQDQQDQQNQRHHHQQQYLYRQDPRFRFRNSITDTSTADESGETDDDTEQAPFHLRGSNPRVQVVEGDANSIEALVKQLAIENEQLRSQLIIERKQQEIQLAQLQEQNLHGGMGEANGTATGLAQSMSSLRMENDHLREELQSLELQMLEMKSHRRVAESEAKTRQRELKQLTTERDTLHEALTTLSHVSERGREDGRAASQEEVKAQAELALMRNELDRVTRERDELKLQVKDKQPDVVDVSTHAEVVSALNTMQQDVAAARAQREEVRAELTTMALRTKAEQQKQAIELQHLRDKVARLQARNEMLKSACDALENEGVRKDTELLQAIRSAQVSQAQSIYANRPRQGESSASQVRLSKMHTMMDQHHGDGDGFDDPTPTSSGQQTLSSRGSFTPLQADTLTPPTATAQMAKQQHASTLQTDGPASQQLHPSMASRQGSNLSNKAAPPLPNRPSKFSVHGLPHWDDATYRAPQLGASEAYYFPVTALDSQFSVVRQLQGPKWLRLSEEGVALLHQTEWSVTVECPLVCIKRYGRDEGVVSFQFGSRAPCGNGVLYLATIHMEDIFLVIRMLTTV